VLNSKPFASGRGFFRKYKLDDLALGDGCQSASKLAFSPREKVAESRMREFEDKQKSPEPRGVIQG